MAEERKLVTILFADVTGSTALGDTLDPEDVRAMMARYYDHARHVISNHGGTVEKFIGDAVMAVFGLPQAHGDDAERALAAALALRSTIAHDEVLAPLFTLCIGINTGNVIASSDPSASDFLVTGDAVNVAARLQQRAEPGEILVGERTMSAAQTSFQFDPPRQLEAKGKRQPLRVFPLRGPLPTRAVVRPPFIGRRQDLLQLSILLDRVLEELRPQMATIIAPAGTGKSRLLEEFLAQVDSSAGIHVTTVRCLPYGQTLTYWPLRGLLSELLGTTTNKASVTNIFRMGGYNLEEATDFAESILTTLGMDGEGMVARECIFTAWRLLIEIIAQQAPRIIIFEDLHWASDNMLDLVDYITNLRIQAPLLLIALSRPELLDRRPNWGGGRQNFTSLTLQPLTTNQTRAMVQQLLTAGSPELHDQIVERSGGNPFFILELVRCLQEGELTETTTAPATLPDTVHAAVLARLDRLSPQERAVLQVASASPRRFRSTMLHVILDTYTAQEIEDALDGLLAREFIVSLEGDFFTFQHMLIHDVTYGTLSRPERVRLHSKIAAWLEVAAADQLDEFIELIAYHFREAIILARQSTIPLALPIDTEHAIHALSRAGKLASRAGLFIEAQTHLRTAIQIAPETKLLDLYEQLGDCTVWGKNATNAYNEALTRWRQTATNQPLVGARLLRKLLICVTRGFSGESLDDEQLLSLREEAMQLAITAGNEDERWRIQLIDLFCHFSPALPVDIQQGKKIAMDAAEHFKQKGDWVAFSEALDGYAGIALKHGHFREALTASQLRLTAADLPAIERSDAFHMIARAYILLGDYDRCITMAEEAFTQIKPTQTQLQFNMFLGDILFAAFLSGQWSKINTFLTTMKDIWEQIKHEPEACWYMKSSDYALLQVAVAQEDHALTNQAISILLRRHPESKTLHRTFITAIQNDDPHVLHLDLSKIEPDITSHALLFHILLFHNEHGIALPEAFIAKANYHRETQNDALIRCGEISRALASTDNSHLEQAIDAAESHQLLAHAARMRVVLAQRTGNPAHLERARPVLQTINDRLYLRKLDEVAATLLPPVH